MQPKIYPGLSVRTLTGEIDTDRKGNERHTPPNTWGHIADLNHADHWNLVFPNGGWVVVTEAELLDPKQYTLREPQTLEQRALALQYGQDTLGLTILDGPMMSLAQEVAGNPAQILALVKGIRDLQEDAADMLDVLRRAWNRWDHLDQEDNPTLGDDLKNIADTHHSWEEPQATTTA